MYHACIASHSPELQREAVLRVLIFQLPWIPERVIAMIPERDVSACWSQNKASVSRANSGTYVFQTLLTSEKCTPPAASGATRPPS